MLSIPQKLYTEMKQLINDQSMALQRISTSIDRASLTYLKQKWNKSIDNLQSLFKSINQEFKDGKITKNSLEMQIDSLHQSLRMLKSTQQDKDKNITKYQSEIIKIMHENERLKDYAKKIKEQNKGLKSSIAELKESLMEKVKLYKQHHQQEIGSYKNKIRILEEELKKRGNDVGEELDQELAELEMMEIELEN